MGCSSSKPTGHHHGARHIVAMAVCCLLAGVDSTTVSSRAAARQSTIAQLESGNAGITKVVTLLQDMEKQVIAETKKGEEEADAMENDCTKDTTELEGEVKFTGQKAEELAGRKEGQEGKAAGFAGEVEKLGPEIAQAESTKTAAKKGSFLSRP